MTLIEMVARHICVVQTPQIDPDTMVEWGEPMRAPKGTRVVLKRNQCPAWQIFSNDAHAAIVGLRAWIDALPAKTDDEFREQAGAIALIDDGIAAPNVTRETI